MKLDWEVKHLLLSGNFIVEAVVMLSSSHLYHSLERSPLYSICPAKLLVHQELGIYHALISPTGAIVD